MRRFVARPAALAVIAAIAAFVGAGKVWGP
jgi:hypothetical protein